MTISRYITAVFESTPRSGVNHPPPLRTGSILRGEVLEIRPDGKALIDFGQARVLADVRFPITPGTIINARVDSIGKPLRLIHLPGVPNLTRSDLGESQSHLDRQEALLKSLSGLIERVATDEHARGFISKPLPESIRQALSALRYFCLPLEIDGKIELIAGQLKQWIENSGIYFEQRLLRYLTNITANTDLSISDPDSIKLSTRDLVQADLKANLIILKEYLDRGSQQECLPGLSPKGVEELKATVGSLLDEMVDRLQSVIKNRDSEHYLFSHLLNLTPEDHRGLLQIKIPKQNRALSDTDIHLSMLLQLNRIGHIRADLWLSASGLQVTLVVADLGVKQLIEDNIQDLNSLLHRHFGSFSVGVRISDTMEPDNLTGDSLSAGFFHQRTIDTSA